MKFLRSLVTLHKATLHNPSAQSNFAHESSAQLNYARKRSACSKYAKKTFSLRPKTFGAVLLPSAPSNYAQKTFCAA